MFTYKKLQSLLAISRQQSKEHFKQHPKKEKSLHIGSHEYFKPIIDNKTNNRARNGFSHKKQASIQMLACQKSQQFSTNSR